MDNYQESSGKSIHKDPRKNKTRAAILSAFNHLFFEDEEKNIRVGDVVDRAGIGRSTFYEHFGSVEDLYASALAHPMSILANAMVGTASEEELISLLDHFMENQQRARRTLDGPRRQSVVKVLSTLLEERLQGWHRKNPTPRQVVLRHLAEAPIALVGSWVAGDIWCSNRELARAIITVTQISMDGLLTKN
ncbi:MAG: TetR/AcrR family transcriptional regulator [Pseudomonadota bacterium]